MDDKNILIDDTNGDLEKDLFKLYPERAALSVWFPDVSRKDKRTLSFSTDNIRYASIPDISDTTYLTFLAYNGTLGLKDKVFSYVVAEDQGIHDVNSAPILNYSPDNAKVPEGLEEIDNVVIDIKMYNGTVDVITYQEGVLFQGVKIYQAMSIRSYPIVATKLPNLDYRKVFLDGWYSYTQVLYRDVLVGGSVVKGSFYGYRGDVFKATNDGIFAINQDGSLIVIVTSEVSDLQSTDINYEEILFSLNATSSSSAQGNSVFLHSQVLITDEIRDAIIKETLEVAMCASTGLDFADWQKLTLKRNSAIIMFENELYENAQIILESARAQCINTGYEICK